MEVDGTDGVSIKVGISAPSDLFKSEGGIVSRKLRYFSLRDLGRVYIHHSLHTWTLLSSSHGPSIRPMNHAQAGGLLDRLNLGYHAALTPVEQPMRGGEDGRRYAGAEKDVKCRVSLYIACCCIKRYTLYHT